MEGRPVRKFGIYHPKGGELNTTCKLEKIVYEHVALVEAENLVRSFYRSQNDFNKDYAALGKRSTSVGDIVTDDETAYMILGNGFRRLSTRHELCKTILEMDKALRFIKLTDDDVDELLENCY